MTNPKGSSPWSPDFPVLSLQMPVDGGGAGPGYWWRQTTKSIQIVIKVPEKTRGKDIDVNAPTLPMHTLFGCLQQR